jgi:hypothetical protein
MSIVLQSSSGGSVTIAEPTTASNFTQTLPAAAGTVMVSGAIPAFSAYANTNQSITAATTTKINFQVEVFDTNNNFASSRFTPTVAGYYQITAGVSTVTASLTNGFFIAIAKNGGQTLVSGYVLPQVTGVVVIGGLVYLNGSTDYVEITAYQGGMAQTTFGRADQTYFQGVLVRAA